VIEPLEPRLLFAAGVPDFRKIVVVVEENRGYAEIVGNANALYINSLASGGALFTNSYAVTHPSLANYLALFSGSTQGVTDDAAHTFSGPNLDTQLKSAAKAFRGYAEAPSLRKHDPWESFTNAASDGRDLGAFPTDFNQLPDVSFVCPNNADNMHDGTVKQGDDWLKAHLKAYADWAKANNSLLVVQWDEDDGGSANHVPTIFYGARVKTGHYSRHLDHYQLLATIEAAKNLSLLNNANTPITDTWSTPPPISSPQVSSIQWMTGKTTTRTIADGASLTSDTKPHGIRVAVSGGNVGSVKFQLSGAASFTTTENGAPYDLFHTAADGGSIGSLWKKGSYTLTIQLFSGAFGTGTKLGQRIVHFVVV
jgi:acid phosphatase